MRLNSVVVAIALLIASTACALALESTLTVSSPLSPNDLWKKVGDFCGMTAWHPLPWCILMAARQVRSRSFRRVISDVPREQVLSRPLCYSTDAMVPLRQLIKTGE